MPLQTFRPWTRRAAVLLAVFAFLTASLWLLMEMLHTELQTESNKTSALSGANKSVSFRPGAIRILSEELTTTGRVYQVIKDGLTNTVIVPAAWRLTPEQLETMVRQSDIEEPSGRPAIGARNQDLLFYGIALDEKNNAVARAAVEANVMVGRPNQALKREIFRTTGGDDGRFELRVEWGQQMQITVQAGTNYISPEPQWFQYGAVGSQPIHRPDPLTPVTFRFQTRQPKEPLFEFTKGYRIPNDGTPVRVDLTTGELVPAGGDLVVTLHALEPYTNLKPFPWTVGMTVVEGGLQKTGGLGTRMEHLFEAPAGGYEPGFLIEYGPASESYRRQHDGWYFVSSRNGRIYAKLFFSCEPYWDERGIAFGLRAVVNTNASRYLHAGPR